MKNLVLVLGLSLFVFVSAAKLDPSNIKGILKKIKPTDERIRSQGYPAESHYVETEDGYILNLFRIPFSYKLQNRNVKRPAILLQHGLFSNSDSWLTTGPDHALAFLLADAGFDVWLGNARGNIYSRNNTKISHNNPKFWHFDWHEIGVIDTPTMIDYIIEATGEQQIHYVGHSQGTTVYFVMMSEMPEYNTKIKSAHMLAPCAFFEHTTSLAFKMLRPLVGKPGSIRTKALSNMELLPYNTMIASVADTACGTDPSVKFVCNNLWILFAGEGFTNTNLTAIQVLVETHPGGASSNQLIHFVQLTGYNKGRFCRMDFGAKSNKKMYGQSTPPDYNLANIKAPTYLYSSNNDSICAPKDVDTLVANIPSLAGNYRVSEPSFNHFEYVLAHNMKALINDPIIANIFSHEDSL